MGIASWQMELVKVILEKDGPQFNRMDVLMKKKGGIWTQTCTQREHYVRVKADIG